MGSQIPSNVEPWLMGWENAVWSTSWDSPVAMSKANDTLPQKISKNSNLSKLDKANGVSNKANQNIENMDPLPTRQRSKSLESMEKEQKLVQELAKLNISISQNTSIESWLPLKKDAEALNSWQLESPVAEIEEVSSNASKDSNQSNGIEDELARRNLYKTELCRSFGETGVCRYGHKCQFAHGNHELRLVLRHPKYKTDSCKTFTSTGSCPYGSRCRFIHPTAINGSSPLPLPIPAKAGSVKKEEGRQITDMVAPNNIQWSTNWNVPQTSPVKKTKEKSSSKVERDHDAQNIKRLAIFQYIAQTSEQYDRSTF